MILPSTKVAIFGGGGALGLRVLPLLREAGVKTKCLIRGSKTRLSPSVRDCVDEVIVGDVLDPKCADLMCQDADVIISMLTPSPILSTFIQLHVSNLDSILSAINKSENKPRLIVVGGAGVMERSWKSPFINEIISKNLSVQHQLTNIFTNKFDKVVIEAEPTKGGSFVTDTFPGRFVKTLLPIYHDFFVAHKLNLNLLQKSGLHWTMICPGFLRDGSHKSDCAFEVRLWEDSVNDERLGGLSATYEDVAKLILAEVKHGKGGVGVHGKRIGIESSHNYYLSLIPSTLSVIGWQLQKWQSSWF